MKKKLSIIFIITCCLNSNSQTLTNSVTEYGKYKIFAKTTYYNGEFIAGIDVYKGDRPIWSILASNEYYEEKGLKNFIVKTNHGIIAFENEKFIYFLSHSTDGTVYLSKFNTDGELITEKNIEMSFQVFKDIHKNFTLLKDGFLITFGDEKVAIKKFDFDGNKVSEIQKPKDFRFIEFETIKKTNYAFFHQPYRNKENLINCKLLVNKLNSNGKDFEKNIEIDIPNIDAIYDIDVDDNDNFLIISKKIENKVESIGIHKYSKDGELIFQYVLTSQVNMVFNGFEYDHDYLNIIFGIKDEKSIEKNGMNYNPNNIYLYKLINRKKEFQTVGMESVIIFNNSIENLLYYKIFDYNTYLTFKYNGYETNGAYSYIFFNSDAKTNNYRIEGILDEKLKNIYFYKL